MNSVKLAITSLTSGTLTLKILFTLPDMLAYVCALLCNLFFLHTSDLNSLFVLRVMHTLICNFFLVGWVEKLMFHKNLGDGQLKKEENKPSL